MELLSINGISKRLGGQTVLEKVSFQVRSGEFLSILGASGCGKTTLLRIIIGLTPPDSGTISLDGCDITNRPPNERRMGIVFQNYALFENMTVLRNVEYAMRLRPELRATSRQVAMDLLAQLGLAEHARKYPAQLSGGQMQRVAIARTLALRPSVILFDEPMSALDVAARLALREELKRIQRQSGATMLYVTHDQEEAFAMSDQIMVMGAGGQIHQLAAPAEILQNPADDYVRCFVLDNLQTKIASLLQYAVK